MKNILPRQTIESLSLFENHIDLSLSDKTTPRLGLNQLSEVICNVQADRIFYLSADEIYLDIIETTTDQHRIRFFGSGVSKLTLSGHGTKEGMLTLLSHFRAASSIALNVKWAQPATKHARMSLLPSLSSKVQMLE